MRLWSEHVTYIVVMLDSHLFFSRLFFLFKFRSVFDGTQIILLWTVQF